jgi:hypothetical protein
MVPPHQKDMRHGSVTGHSVTLDNGIFSITSIAFDRDIITRNKKQIIKRIGSLR